MLRNAGNEATVVSSIASNNAEFAAVDQMPITVLPFDSLRTKIVFSPISLGSKSGRLTITSNAEDNPVINVSLTKTGIPSPQINVSPSSFRVSLNGGDSLLKIVTINNSGGDTLSFNAAVSFNQTAWYY